MSYLRQYKYGVDCLFYLYHLITGDFIALNEVKRMS